MEKAVFGGGCFWCTEAIFKILKGVNTVLPGYSGGSEEDATYAKVSTGTTRHVEVTYLEYDPSEIKFHDILTVFFASHDPTTVNRQGNDVGPQYRSVIFFTTPEQEAEAGRYIKEIQGAVTELEPLENFYQAENYHHDYYEAHKDTPYCQIIINPKLEKVQKDFTSLLKQKHE